MLSFIVRVTQEFEQEHGKRPNLLYLNPEHVVHLQRGFDDCYDLAAIMRMLNMELLIDQGAVHPHVAWVAPAAAKRAV